VEGLALRVDLVGGSASSTNVVRELTYRQTYPPESGHIPRRYLPRRSRVHIEQFDRKPLGHTRYTQRCGLFCEGEGCQWPQSRRDRLGRSR
jgi:hypothetical protein